MRYYDKYYPAWKRRSARWLVVRGMRAQERRALAAAARGHISPAELQARIETYRQVQTLATDPTP